LRNACPGSFGANADEPNDVGGVLLLGDRFPLDAETETELDKGLPFWAFAIAL
jgi:hypothetical protein